METLVMVSKIVWIGVGITAIGTTIYCMRWSTKFYKSFTENIKED